MTYVKGEDRNQITLFPEAIDDYITEDNPVRVIEAFVNSLDMQKLGFQKAEPKNIGRPAYDPRDLLKLYLYGYLNRVRSSICQERCHVTMSKPAATMRAVASNAPIMWQVVIGGFAEASPMTKRANSF